MKRKTIFLPSGSESEFRSILRLLVEGSCGLNDASRPLEVPSPPVDIKFAKADSETLMISQVMSFVSAFNSTNKLHIIALTGRHRYTMYWLVS